MKNNNAPKEKKLVLVPCHLDNRGKVIATKPPYGYHRILKVFDDGSNWPVATIWHSVDETTVWGMMRLLAGSLPCTIERDFDKSKKKRKLK